MIRLIRNNPWYRTAAVITSIFILPMSYLLILGSSWPEYSGATFQWTVFITLCFDVVASIVFYSIWLCREA